MSGTVLVGSFERSDFALQGMELRREYYVFRGTQCGEDVTCYIGEEKVPKAGYSHEAEGLDDSVWRFARFG
jgi:hypothetical protein